MCGHLILHFLHHRVAFTLVRDIKAEELTKSAVRHEFAKRAFDPRRLAYRLGQLLPELMLSGETLPASARDPYDPEAYNGLMMRGLIDVVAELARRANETKDKSLLLRTPIEPFAHPVLAEYHDDSAVRAILDDTWERYAKLEPDIPVASKLGPTINLRLTGATLAVHEALCAAGHTEDQATSIFLRIAWSIYERMGDLPMAIAGLLTSNDHARMKTESQAFRDFPFSSPDYVMVDVGTDDSTVGFDVLSCPVAELFRKAGKSELCYATWCSLDYPLARKWGGDLVRTTTIAQGAERCDFRWKTPKREPSRTGEQGLMQSLSFGQ